MKPCSSFDMNSKWCPNDYMDKNVPQARWSDITFTKKDSSNYLKFDYKLVRKGGDGDTILEG